MYYSRKAITEYPFHGVFYTVKTEKPIDGNLLDGGDLLGGDITIDYNYNRLLDKPQINSVYLFGNKTDYDLGLVETEELQAGSSDVFNEGKDDGSLLDLDLDTLSLNNDDEVADDEVAKDDEVADDGDEYVLSYNKLVDKPTINSVVLEGSSNAKELNLVYTDDDDNIIIKSTETKDTDTIDTEGSSLIDVSYNQTVDKPQINLVTLVGNKSSQDLGLLEVEDLDSTDTGDGVLLRTSCDIQQASKLINSGTIMADFKVFFPCPNSSKLPIRFNTNFKCDDYVIPINGRVVGLEYSQLGGCMVDIKMSEV